MADCDDFDAIAAWGTERLEFLRTILPFYHGIPTGRWLNILMNRMDPDLFAACFTDWVREIWPERADFIAIDGKTSRRSHDRGNGKNALHLVSAFATETRLVLGQEAVPDKASETTAIPVLIERLADNRGLEGAVVSIDAIACNGTIAGAIKAAGADYLLAVKGNQPGLRAEMERMFADAPTDLLETASDVDKGHGRLEHRSVTVCRETDWLSGHRRFPGELRLPGVATLIKIDTRTETKAGTRAETRYYISSALFSAEAAGRAVRGHWAIENSLHWVLDVTFKDDLSRVRTGHGARNMALVRHFAFNIVRAAKDKHSLKLRRKKAGWDTGYLASLLGIPPR